ncbi:hypothetical protein ACFS5N_02545 [Mucilaginibacter ximonensis]|uniref:CHRD domain-containing protein n=1 Tax=Mucilaginibacter ximonensis TaxID=538021 RepID=A0ABW5Y7R7_9SPHI
MKRVFTLIACFFVLFASCKKDKNQAPAYYVTADVDGTSFNFTSNNLARLMKGKNGGSLATNSELSLYGATRIDQDADAISIVISEPATTIGTGTYTGGVDDSRFVSIQYLIGPFSASAPNEYVSDLSDGGMAVKITSIDNNTVQGTFRGTLYHNGSEKSITNGKFNLPINQ